MVDARAASLGVRVAVVAFVALAALWLLRRLFAVALRLVEFAVIVAVALVAAYVAYELWSGWRRGA